VAMLSNHYGWLYSGQNNWFVLVLLMLAGALIRHSFVARHKALVLGKRVPWEHAVGGVAALLALAVWLVPAPEAEAPMVASAPAAAAAAPAAAAAAGATAHQVSFQQVKGVIDQRCVMCHSAQLQSKGLAFDNPASIKRHAQQMYQQAVVLKLMPLNNATQITAGERDLLKRWYEEGAPVE